MIIFGFFCLIASVLFILFFEKYETNRFKKLTSKIIESNKTELNNLDFKSVLKDIPRKKKINVYYWDPKVRELISLNSAKSELSILDVSFVIIEIEKLISPDKHESMIVRQNGTCFRIFKIETKENALITIIFETKVFKLEDIIKNKNAYPPLCC